MTDKTELPTVPDANPERCETCRFWQDDLRDSWFEDSEKLQDFAPCRRFPPRALVPGEVRGPNKSSSIYPATEAADWCGEWRPFPPKPLTADQRQALKEAIEKAPITGTLVLEDVRTYTTMFGRAVVDLNTPSLRAIAADGTLNEDLVKAAEAELQRRQAAKSGDNPLSLH